MASFQRLVNDINMYRKYEKTYRILVPQIDVKGKHYLSDADTKKLLSGNVNITEKIDGANVGIIRHKDGFKLQKRGSLVDASEHMQFNFFKAWSQNNYDRLMQIPDGHTLYGELVIAKHTIYYDKLPDYFLAFALVDRTTDEYKNWDQLRAICASVGISTVPFLSNGFYNRSELFSLIPAISTYGSEPAEGIVVWNNNNHMRGKVVREEFIKDMEDSVHWQHKSVVKNLLDKK